MDPLRKKALDLLSRREHSRAQLARKLRQRGFEAEAIEATLDWLRGLGYLDEERFARLAAEGERRRGHGPLRARRTLLRAGLDGALVERALDAAWAESDPAAELRELCERRFGPPADMTRQEREKAFRFLVRRGFPQGAVRGLLLDG